MENWKNKNVADLPGETWKDIKGYEGFYQVSSLGRIKSLERRIPCVGDGRITKTFIMAQSLKKNGYLSVMLSKNRNKKTISVHRIVALAFWGEPLGDKNVVNHKDESSINNCANNLEWVTSNENKNYGTAIARSRKLHINHPSISRPVVMKDKNGNILKSYPSISQASRETGVNIGNISNCCRTRRWLAGGYDWEFKN